MRAMEGKEQDWVFQAPWLFVKIFCGLLVVWTVGTAPLIWQKIPFREQI